MSKINQYNEKGQPHGLWKHYYSQGQLMIKVTYVNGKKHGLWESYYSNNQIMYKGVYVNGKNHGLWEYYHPNGTIDKQVFYSKYYEQD
jgi:antitoxin component YwqK of YwqJK toxin-antitoxin module